MEPTIVSEQNWPAQLAAAAFAATPPNSEARLIYVEFKPLADNKTMITVSVIYQVNGELFAEPVNGINSVDSIHHISERFFFQSGAFERGVRGYSFFLRGNDFNFDCFYDADFNPNETMYSRTDRLILMYFGQRWIPPWEWQKK